MSSRGLPRSISLPHGGSIQEVPSPRSELQSPERGSSPTDRLSAAEDAPVPKPRRRKKKKRSNSQRTASVKRREAEAVQAYVHRSQLWQSADARNQERLQLLLRTRSSTSVVLPPVLGVPSVPSSPSAVSSAGRLGAQVHAPPPRLVTCQQRLCGFLPSAQTGIDTLLSVLKLEPSDTFYDLGCGDGRIVLSVVKRFKCKGVGVDLNGALIQQALSRARKEFAESPELLDNVSFVEKDIGHMPLDDASAVYIYMPLDALHTLCSRVLPCTAIRDGTLIYTEEYWLHDRAALRHCKWKASHWDGQIHCYEWQCAYGRPERTTF